MVEHPSPAAPDDGVPARLARRVAAAALLVLLALCGRVAVMGISATREGVAALAAGDEAAALRALERGAHAWLPGAPWVEDALDGLAALGQRRAARGDRAGAVAAWSAVRGAILGSRALWTPHRDRLAQADGALAELWIDDAGAPWPDPAASPVDRRAEALRVLGAAGQPDPGWSALAVVSFLGWVGAAVGLILRGFREDGRLVRRAALRWSGALVLGFALWLLGMVNA